jgi:hypothetical protein
MQMLQNVLANPSAPGHDVIHAAWTNNLNLLTGVSMIPGVSTITAGAGVPSFAVGQAPSWAMMLNIAAAGNAMLNNDPNGGTALAMHVAAYATIGEVKGVERVGKAMNDSTLKGSVLKPVCLALHLIDDATFDSTYPTFVSNTVAALNSSGVATLGANGDADGDGYSNLTEWNAATGADWVARAADFATRATRNDPPPSLSVAVAGAPTGAIASGTNVTLTATPSNGTAPYSYVWKKNGVAVGVTTAAYTFTALVGSNSYTCEVMDAVTPQAVASAPVVVNALDSATLPVMGVAGIALLAGLAGAFGVRKIRK